MNIKDLTEKESEELARKIRASEMRLRSDWIIHVSSSAGGSKLLQVVPYIYDRYDLLAMQIGPYVLGGVYTNISSGTIRQNDKQYRTSGLLSPLIKNIVVKAINDLATAEIKVLPPIPEKFNDAQKKEYSAFFDKISLYASGMLVGGLLDISSGSLQDMLESLLCFGITGYNVTLRDYAAKPVVKFVPPGSIFAELDNQTREYTRYFYKQVHTLHEFNTWFVTRDKEGKEVDVKTQIPKVEELDRGVTVIYCLTRVIKDNIITWEQTAVVDNGTYPITNVTDGNGVNVALSVEELKYSKSLCGVLEFRDKDREVLSYPPFGLIAINTRDTDSYGYPPLAAVLHRLSALNKLEATLNGAVEKMLQPDLAVDKGLANNTSNQLNARLADPYAAASRVFKYDAAAGVIPVQQILLTTPIENVLQVEKELLLWFQDFFGSVGEGYLEQPVDRMTAQELSSRQQAAGIGLKAYTEEAVTKIRKLLANIIVPLVSTLVYSTFEGELDKDVKKSIEELFVDGELDTSLVGIVCTPNTSATQRQMELESLMALTNYAMQVGQVSVEAAMGINYFKLQERFAELHNIAEFVKPIEEVQRDIKKAEKLKKEEQEQQMAQQQAQQAGGQQQQQ